MESLFLVLITNKNSNIIEDLDTLNLLSKILPEQCQPVTEVRIKLPPLALCLFLLTHESTSSAGDCEGQGV
jgi:hypothetical protein